ncbi:MAG: HEAT repeat domain-containing protein [Candidatus Eisenbacteria bacterium]|uniref:peptidylprolyl isomerase n=1 Tax=Eiseniibacteriota bacterium TaxID=2212470 RepID=A0A948WBE7_UNCEI|nr:HEAT repeat domain-containing protein [Candidatus Eisenbacteria bacterium]
MAQVPHPDPGAAFVPSPGESMTGWTLRFPVLEPSLEADIVAIEDGREDPSALKPFIGHTHPEVRIRAAYALGRIGGDGARELLKLLLEDPIARVRRAAAFGLGEANGSEEIALHLRRHLSVSDEFDPATRALCVEALAKLGLGDEPDQLLQTLQDPDRLVVQAALLSLWRLAPQGMAERALELCHDHDPAMRWKAGYALMRLAGTPASGRTPIPEGGELSKAMHDEILLRFLEMVDDPAAIVRMQAIRGLGGMPEEGVLETVITQAAHPDSRVRIEVVRALGRLEAPAAQMAPFLRDPVPPVRLEALRSLATAADPEEALRFSEPFLKADESWAREAAVAARADLFWSVEQADRLEEMCRAMLKDPAWNVRAEVIRLAEREDERGAFMRRLLGPEAERWFATEDPRVLKFAAGVWLRQSWERDHALAPGRPFRIELERWLNHEDEMVRAMGYDALINIAGEMRSEHRINHVDVPDPAPWEQHFQSILNAGLEDPSADVRGIVVDGISSLVPIGPAEWNLLSKALRDEEYTVRVQAAAILSEHGVRVPYGVPGRAAGMSRKQLEAVLYKTRRWHIAEITTSKGLLKLDLFSDQAPLTVANFARLAEEGYYNNTVWHRIEPDFVAQDGCPRGDGWGGPGYTIRCEINTCRYGAGALGMALSGKDTGGSQYFITHSPQPHLDGGYTVFGQMREGWDVLMRLAPGDRILKVVVK